MSPFQPTPEQERILAHDRQRHGVILAGPGTGKSATVVAYIESLAGEEEPPRVKLLTFTRAATAELALKVSDHPGIAAERPSTIHSFAISVLLRNPGAADFPQPLRMADDWEYDELVRPTLPDGIEPGEHLTLQCTVTDDVILKPFENIARLNIVKKSEHPPGNGDRRTPRGTGTTNDGTDDTEPSGIELPDIVKVKEGDTNWQKFKFDERTSCKIIVDAEGDGDDEKDVYTFYVNVDNVYLRTDMKSGLSDARVQEAKFIYGNVCIGLALINDLRNKPTNGKNGKNGSRIMPMTCTRSHRDRATHHRCARSCAGGRGS